MSSVKCTGVEERLDACEFGGLAQLWGDYADCTGQSSYYVDVTCSLRRLRSAAEMPDSVRCVSQPPEDKWTLPFGSRVKMVVSKSRTLT